MFKDSVPTLCLRLQTKRDTWVYTVRGRSRFASGIVCSSDVTVQASRRQRYSGRGPHRLKKRLSWNQLKGMARYRANCLPGPQEQFKRNNMDLAPGAAEVTSGVFSQ